MLFAAAIAVAAVVLGVALGLVPAGHTRIAGPLRTFALSAALTVVLLHLMPEAFARLGFVALLLFAATSVLPLWFGLVRGLFGSHAGHDHGHAHLVAGYLGLLVHHVGDGLGLGAFASLPGGAREHADVMLALAVHTVPLVAVVAFAFRDAGGSKRAVRAAAGLAGASVLGVLLSAVVPSASVERYGAWVAAFVAGLLVHVVTHDLGRDLPTGLGSRTVDLLAAALGVAASLLGAGHAAERHPASFVALGAGILGVLAVPVLAGWFAVTLAKTGKETPFRRTLEAAFGTTLGLDALLIVAYAGGLVRGALFAAGMFLVVRAVVAYSRKDPELVALPPAPVEPVPWLLRFDQIVGATVGWIGVGLAFYVLMQSSIPQLGLAVLPLPVAFALAVVVALPARIPAGAAAIIAVALERAGLPFAVALVFALLAPTPGVVELTQMARRKGSFSALGAGVAFTLCALAFGVVAAIARDAKLMQSALLFPDFTPRFPVLLLGAFAVRAAFDRGLRGLLLEVFPSHDTVSPETPRAEEPAA